MASLRDVHASNAQLSQLSTLENSQKGLTFVFAGATAGIGLYTLQALARHAQDPDAPPTAYIIGRSRAKFQPQLDELRRVNPNGVWVFVEAQITLLKETERAARVIIKAEREREGGGRVDALVMSPGFLTFNASREDTEEGIDADSALQYYSRFLLLHTLLPVLLKSPSPRVVSIMAAGQEGTFTAKQLQSEFRGEDWPGRIASAGANAALNTTSFEVLAQQYPTISFIHSYPGGVQTDIITKLFDTAKGWWTYPAQFVKNWIAPVLLRFIFYVTPEEAGERHLFLATSTVYPPAAAVSEVGDNVGKTREGAVGLVGELKRATLTVVEGGKRIGVYRTKYDGKTYPDMTNLQKLREGGLDVLGWRETLKVFERVLGEGYVAH